MLFWIYYPALWSENIIDTPQIAAGVVHWRQGESGGKNVVCSYATISFRANTSPALYYSFLPGIRLLKICNIMRLRQPASHPAFFFNGTRNPFLYLAVFFLLTSGLLITSLPETVSGAQLPYRATASRENKKLYAQAKDYLHRLQQTPARGKDRLNWLAGVRNFRRLYLLNTRGPLAPACLYMMAGMYQQMYHRFHLPIDLDESINTYLQLASEFADNRLADDALFAVATLYQREKKDPKRSSELYKKIISHYPQGDQCTKTRKKIAELTQHDRISASDSPADLPTTPLADILPVKHWSSSDYTRIVIQASKPVAYTTSLLEKDGDQPRRLYIDLKNSTIAPQFQTPVPIEDGLLKRVRTGQFNDNTVRVVLDIESISDYKIFNLKDPFKIVIDVHGIKTKTKKIKTKAAAAKPAVPVSELPKTQPKVGATASLPSFIILEDFSKTRPRHHFRSRVHQTSTVHKTRESRLSLAQQLGLGIRKIIIDPGHGGKDPGAMAFGLKEKDIVLKVAKKVKNLLKKKYNYEVSLTRKTDIFIPLEERTALANTAGADLFVSIHVNAHPDKATRGIETFYLNLATNGEAMRVAARENATSTHNINEMQHILTDLMQNSKILESSRLARFVQTNMISGLRRRNYQVKDHGVKKAPFYVLIGAQMPAVLVEISFITNPIEAKRLRNDSFLSEISDQIAAGISAYVNQHMTAAAQY